MSTELFIGGLNARTAFGFVTSRVEGLHGAPGASLTPQIVPGKPGAILLADPQIDVRTLTIRGVILADTPAAARVFRDRLLTIVQRQVLTLRTADDASREISVVMTGVNATPVGAQFTSRQIPLEFTCTALDPYWRDVTPTVVTGIATTPVPCPLGSASIRPVLTVTTPGSVIRIAQRDALGVLITDLQLAGLSAGIALTIDCAAQTIRQGVVSQMHTLIAGDFPVLNPVTQADVIASAWPTLSVSQGTMVATYRRAWV